MSQADYADFKIALRNPVVIEGTLEFTTLLHIGAGGVQLGSDNPLYTCNGRYLIPATSLKGAFRSEFEKVARESGERVCDIVSKPCEPREWCIVCGTFGGRELASHIRFYDAELEGQPEVVLKTGIAINRFTRTVHPERLYNIEALVNPKFKFKAVYYLARVDNRWKLLTEVLKKAARGELQIGGRKSTGFGMFYLNLSKITPPTEEAEEIAKAEEDIKKAYEEARGDESWL